MCRQHSDPSHARDFNKFCAALRRWLTEAPVLDPPLAAAVELLDRRATSQGLSWFECEATHVAWNAEDMHAALGACVVLSLWNAAQTGRFSLP